MSEPKAESELARVLAESDECASEMQRCADVIRAEPGIPDGGYKRDVVAGNERMSKAHADAARLLREMAEDFGRAATHAECFLDEYDEDEREESAWLDAARKKWELPS